MALTRKFLLAMGIEPEKVDEIITAHIEVTDGLKKEIENYKADSEKLTQVKEELKTAKEQLEGYGKDDTYKVKYEAIKEDFEKYKKDIESEKEKTTKAQAFKDLLKGIGISDKRIDAVMKVSGDAISNLVIEDGKIVDKAKLEKSLKEEWADFIVNESGVVGENVAHPPKGDDAKSLTKDEIFKIKDATERQAKLKEYLLNEEEE